MMRVGFRRLGYLLLAYAHPGLPVFVSLYRESSKGGLFYLAQLHDRTATKAK